MVRVKGFFHPFLNSLPFSGFDIRLLWPGGSKTGAFQGDTTRSSVIIFGFRSGTLLRREGLISLAPMVGDGFPHTCRVG